MNQRYQPDYSRGRQGGRPQEDSYRGMRGQYAGRDDAELGGWDGDGGRMYGASEAEYEPGYPQGPYEPQRYDQAARSRGGQYGGQGLQSYPGSRNQMQGQQYDYNRPYGPDDFRQGSGQRQWQQAEFNRQGQRQYAGQGGRASSNLDQNYGYGNYNQQRYQAGGMNQGQNRYHGAMSPGGYARDYDEGDYDQSFGGYSPSQRGYGDSYSGYGSGGYGSQYGQGFDEEFMGTTNSTVQSGAYGQGPGGYGGGFSQGLAGRGGYGAGSGYTGGGFVSQAGNYAASTQDFSRPQSGIQRQSQFGRGPKGYARTDERIKEQISERLMRDHDVDASDIDVEVRNGKVTLTGSIDDRRLKHYVEDTVEQCLGVTDVDNRLTVKSRSQQQGGSGSLGGSTGQSSATGTTGSRVSTGSASGTGSGTTGSGSGEDGGTRSRN